MAEKELLEQFRKALDRIDAVYEEYNRKCIETREKVPCRISHLLGSEIRRLYSKLETLEMLAEVIV